MADARFYDRGGPFTLAQLAGRAGLTLAPGADPDYRIDDVCGLEALSDNLLSFAQGKHLKALAGARAGAAIVPAGTAPIPGFTQLLHTAAPDRAFVAVTGLFYPAADCAAAIDPSARVHATASLEEGVSIGANAVIGEGVEIGRGTVVGAGVVLGRGVAIGRDCRIGANSVLSHSLLGDRVTLHPNCSFGQDGFGYLPGAEGHLKVPQLGRVIIQNDVEIGAGCTVDRGRLGDTVIGEGTKIDNQVHIAHNCQIGRNCIIAAQCGMSGSVKIGDFAVLLGQVGLADHITIAPHTIILAKAGVSKSTKEGEVFAGYPARPVQQWHKEVATLTRLTRARKAGPAKPET